MTKKELEDKVQLLEEKLAAIGNGERIIDIIYPNVEKFVQWEEMKYSLRSLEMNLVDVSFRVWIVGEKPEWVSDKVRFIPVEYTGETPRIDILHKHMAVINHPEIGEEYIWMNDDIYFVNKVMYADFCIPVAVNNLERNKAKYDRQTVWGKDNLHTLEILKREGLTTYNYAAHIPHRFEKSKIRQIIEEFNMMEDPVVLTQIYYNYWFRDFLPYWDSLEVNNNQGFCVNRENPNWKEFENQLKIKKYLNNSEAGMSEKLKARLKQMFPTPSQFEK